MGIVRSIVSNREKGKYLEADRLFTKQKISPHLETHTKITKFVVGFIGYVCMNVYY